MASTTIQHPASSPLGDTFRERNTALTTLPLDILSSESAVREHLAELEQSPLPLSEKLRLIDERELTPFLTGSRLRGDFRLLLHLSDDLDLLTIARINTPLTELDLNPAQGAGDGALHLDGLDRTPLIEVRDPHLLYSAFDLSRFARGHVQRELAAQLYLIGRRITTYRGVSITWDQAIDRRVWTTNIDTVFFIHQLFADGVFARSDIESAIEIGVGGGAISKMLLARLPALREHTATDISPYALICAKRNLLPVLRPDQVLNLFLGKGLRAIDAKADLLLVNPPYIPHRRKPDAVDPYRGTGLIKEVVEIGLRSLNPVNPRAAIYMGMSNLAHRDLHEYLGAHPEVKATPVGSSREVPLKILSVNEDDDWVRFLEQEHGLITSAERAERTGFPFWHQLSVVKLERAS